MQNLFVQYIRCILSDRINHEDGNLNVC